MSDLLSSIESQKLFRIRQRMEMAEFFGFETRNKYEIASEDGAVIGFCAEQGKGFLGLFLRGMLGHWRRFDVHVFDAQRQAVLRCHHPFRFIFQRFEVHSADGRFLGALQQRFSILKKRFDVEDASGSVVLKMSSPFWKIWTFPFFRGGVEVARVSKRWGGLMKEALTDSDQFEVQFLQATLPTSLRPVILCSAIFVDLQYFEKRANR
jgi:uncharacterized protein YxjI